MVSRQRALGMRSWRLLLQRPPGALRPRRPSLPRREAEREAPQSQDLAETLGWDTGSSWALSQGSGPSAGGTQFSSVREKSSWTQVGERGLMIRWGSRGDPMTSGDPPALSCSEPCFLVLPEPRPHYPCWVLGAQQGAESRGRREQEPCAVSPQLPVPPAWSSSAS